MEAQASGATLGRIITGAIARFPDRVVLYDGASRWTYRELGDAIGRFITVLRRLGVGKGDGIAVLSSNRVEPWAIQCAANLMGVRYTPLHPLAAEDDHAHIVEDAGVVALVVEAGKFGDRGSAIAGRIPALKHFLALGPLEGAEDLLALHGQAEPAALIDDGESEAIAYLGYTGGTTGRSKGVMLSHRSLTTMSTIILAEWEWPAEPRYALVTPITHAGGINLYPIMSLGGYARLMQGFDLELFCAAVEEERLNTTFLVPTIVNRLIDAEGVRTRHDLSSIEMIIYGASPMSPDRLRAGIEIFGDVFLQLYGQTECPQVITTLRKADHDLSRPERLGSCGRPAPLIDVRLLDDQLREVNVGQPGEICVRGPLVMSGYWRQPELTMKTFEGDWLHTGDVATRDAEGYLYIVDRTKDLIISGGFNIYPREVEDALMSHPAVSLAAVIGVPDPQWGEAVKAFVILAPDKRVAALDLQAHVKQKRGAAWSPKTVEFLTEIPLTSLGKIDRKTLRAPYWRTQSRAVS